jgi:LacI family transcriptional regulator
METVPITSRPEHAERATLALLDHPQRPDAIVCGLDGAAAPVVRTLQARGLRVPGDVMVASCVDGPLMVATTPAVTSIDLLPAEAGRRAVEMLASIIGGATPRPREQELPTRLVVRGSTGGEV